MTNLTGKTAVITGASSGIGRATALALAKQGVSLVLMARRMEPLEKTAAAVVKAGGKALAIAGDAGDRAAIDSLLKVAVGFSPDARLDIVIVNAGRGLAGGMISSDDAQWEEVYRTNVLGAAYLMRQAGKLMAGQHSGHIVVLGSTVGRNISPFSAFYGSSKFAVGAMAEALRQEVCSQGVKVSLVMPGIVVSGFQKVAGYTPENFGKNAEKYGELLQPEDIAANIVWILSQPPRANICELTIRPAGQSYP
jgi:NADP-dependent 3-hydroxy acid dehydrogenase YdfG